MTAAAGGGTRAGAGSGTGAAWVIVYDGPCTVCTRTVNRIRDLDRNSRFELVPYQNAGVPERFPEITREEFETSVQLIGPDARYEGAAAVEKILALLPRARALAWVFRIPLVRPIAERFYRWFARNRHHFGCGDHCPVVNTPGLPE